RNYLIERMLLTLHQHAGRSLRPQAHGTAGRHVGRVVLGIQDLRECRRPGRVVCVLQPAAWRIDYTRKVAVGMGLLPEIRRGVPRDNARPKLGISMLTD